MVRIGSRNRTPAQITHLMVLIEEGSSAAVIAVSLKRSITGENNAKLLKLFRAICSNLNQSGPNF
jgi:hypothetical protein